MASKREQVLGALHVRLEVSLSATVRRNEVLPERMPAEGLVILRDGDPGAVTLNPRNRGRGPIGPPTIAAGGGESAGLLAGLGSYLAGLFHSRGIAGDDAHRGRAVDAMVFATALPHGRYRRIRARRGRPGR